MTTQRICQAVLLPDAVPCGAHAPEHQLTIAHVEHGELEVLPLCNAHYEALRATMEGDSDDA